MTSSDDEPILSRLDALLRDRLEKRPEGSYSVQVLTDRTLAMRKIMEEAFEVCLEVQADTVDRVAAAEEAADLVFHLQAALVGSGVAWGDVEAVLEERFGRPARHSTVDAASDDGYRETRTCEGFGG